ncbi:hypothetical protein SDJN03_21607, partial [Cucurbita argyrosperma subsp. sororia]
MCCMPDPLHPRPHTSIHVPLVRLHWRAKYPPLSATASFPLPATICASSSLFTSFISPSLLEEAASWRIDLHSSDIGFPISCRWMQCGFDRGASDCPNLCLITGAEMVQLAS